VGASPPHEKVKGVKFCYERTRIEKKGWPSEGCEETHDPAVGGQSIPVAAEDGSPADQGTQGVNDQLWWAGCSAEGD